MLGLNSELESSCLPVQLRYIIHLSHAFECDAVGLPLRPIANRFGRCFCLGSGPVLCFGLFSAVCFAVAAGETQVWLGDLRVVVFGVVVFLVCCFIDLLILRTFLSLYSVLTAYSHVRTEPLVRHRPNSRKKNSRCDPALPVFASKCQGECYA